MILFCLDFFNLGSKCTAPGGYRIRNIRIDEVIRIDNIRIDEVKNTGTLFVTVGTIFFLV